MNVKESNPKDMLGSVKAYTHLIPTAPLYEVGLAMFEGARKYGSHNYRAIGTRATVYYNAARRHMDAWLEGEDIDPDSGIHHLMKAVACFMVLRDSMIMGNFEDDRPLRYADGFSIEKFNKLTEDIINKYPECVEPFTEVNSKKEQS